ncbi:MAG: hypothetical protein WBA89_10210 [Microcoleus sp.]|uniref:hypothetical protein n=1 Tax=Microcoleus sp. TaxID=44472 RepID=UPI003C74B48F
MPHSWDIPIALVTNPETNAVSEADRRYRPNIRKSHEIPPAPSGDTAPRRAVPCRNLLATTFGDRP